MFFSIVYCFASWPLTPAKDCSFSTTRETNFLLIFFWLFLVLIAAIKFVNEKTEIDEAKFNEECGVGNSMDGSLP